VHPDRHCIGLSETAHSPGSAQGCRCSTRVRRERSCKGFVCTGAENKTGHPVLLDGPPHK
jgi:hypothetical protein